MILADKNPLGQRTIDSPQLSFTLSISKKKNPTEDKEDPDRGQKEKVPQKEDKKKGEEEEVEVTAFETRPIEEQGTRKGMKPNQIKKRSLGS